jgi:hypothetical protein
VFEKSAPGGFKMKRSQKKVNRAYLPLLVTVACLLGLIGACAPRKMMVREFAAMVETGMVSFEQDDDLSMLGQAMPANIKLLETMLASSPKDEGLLVLLARLYGSYGFLFLQDGFEMSQNLEDRHPCCVHKGDPQAWREAILGAHAKGAHYALRALAIRHPECEVQLKKVATIEPFLDTLEQRDVGALFWYGFNLGNWVNWNQSSLRAVSRAHVAEKVMLRVLQIQPDYFHGNAHLFLLSYYASRSGMLGGNLDAAQNHYDALKAMAGDDFLLADLIYARHYLRQKQDRQGYVARMQTIIATDPRKTRYPLYNRLAVNRAQRYLEEVDELFE